MASFMINSVSEHVSNTHNFSNHLYSLCLGSASQTLPSSVILSCLGMIYLAPLNFWAYNNDVVKMFVFFFSNKPKTRLAFPQPVGPVNSVACRSLK